MAMNLSIVKYPSKQKAILLLLAILGLSACDLSNSNQTATPDNHSQPNETNTSTVANPSIPIKMDLPISLNGVDSLIHPVVVSAIDEYADKGGGSYDKGIYSMVSVNRHTLTGNMFNLVFENKQTGETKALFKHNTQMIHEADYPVRIISNKINVDYNTTVSENFNQDDLKYYHHFVYQVQENLTKDDSDSINAQLSLYLSDDKGNELKKLHADNEYFIQSRFVPDVERYYFTVKKDSNNDNKITLQDDSKTYYIDFKEITPKVKEYDFMPK